MRPHYIGDPFGDLDKELDDLTKSLEGPLPVLSGNTHDCYYCGKHFPNGQPPMKWRSPKGRYFIGLHVDCHQILFNRKP
jgi:hypothetical protein